MKDLIYFRGGRKGEEILINSNYHALSVGGLISDILNTDMKRLFDGALLIEEQILQPVAKGEKSFEALKKLAQYISGLELSPALKDIFLWQPLIVARSAAAAKQAELEFSFVEQTQYQSEAPAPYHKEQWIELWKNSAVCWDVFAGFLGKGHIMSVSTPDEKERIGLCAKAYWKAYHEMLLAFQRLQNNLSAWLERGALTNEAKNDLIYAGIQTSFVPYEDVEEFFPARKGTLYTQIYTAVRINDLIALEIDLIRRSDQRFRRCALCGRYFVPFSPKSIFCHNPNPEYDGKECRKIGPILKHQDKLHDAPMYAKYLKNCKAYTKWMSDNMKNISGEATTQINDSHNLWMNRARAALADHAEGKITKQELEKALALPPIRERSQLLYEAKQLQKDA